MRLRSLFALWTVLAVPAAAFAQEPRDVGAASARIDRADNGRALTGPSATGRPEIVSQFLSARHSTRTRQTLVLQRETPGQNGTLHVMLGQRVNGLDVYGTYVRAAVNAGGQVLSVVENLAEIPPALVPTNVDPRDALDTVLTQYYAGPDAAITEQRTQGNTVVFSRGARFSEDPTVTRVAVAMTNGALQTGYLVVTWDRENVLRHTVVGNGGRILIDELRTNNDTYKIFPDHPGNSTQTVVNGPGAGNAQSPSGWVTNNTTTGNNVDAYLDRDNNNGADANGRPVSATRNFEYTVDLGQAPTQTTNQMAAVTNLFYLNNVIHDKLYRHGFTEAAGNFQTNNFGKGGSGNDAVRAEAQDGGGTNNANFSTPDDGAAPRMQMYLWNRSNPNRDGDLDSDIVWHEYGHGLTWRMIGNMSGPLAGGIGEGMSDTLSIYINNDDRVGEYAYNSTTGIRRYRYSGYPLTYGNVTGASVHDNGEIYAATMWKLRELWTAESRTQDALFDLVIEGMNYTPAQPAFEHMRDGLLAAADTQEEDCTIWKAFAQFGIGVGARGTASCNFFGCTTSITESFAVPAICSSGGDTPPDVSITGPASGSSFSQGFNVVFTGTAFDGSTDISGNIVWTSSIDGQIGTTGSVSTSTLSVGTHTITASVTDSGGLNDSASISVTITPAPGVTLTLSGKKVKSINQITLNWAGATTEYVHVWRNGTLFQTIPNTGTYTDNTGTKGSRTFTYQVCEVGGPARCSPERTITF